MTPLEAWYYEIPVITRVFLDGRVCGFIRCQLDLVHPLQLHFSFDLVFRSGQYWRLITSFLYFGDFSLDFLFHMFFLQRYARMLEEGSFRGRTADFFWLFVLGGTSIIAITPLVTSRWTTMPFLSSPLTFMLVYIWARRNPYVRMSFLGIFTFTAPYLPWVLLTFTMLLNGVWPTGDLLGMGVGHVYYFLDDVWPRTGNGDRPRLLRAPGFVKRWFEGEHGDVTNAALRDLYAQAGAPGEAGGAVGEEVDLGRRGDAGAVPVVGGNGGEVGSEAWTLVEGDDEKTGTSSSSPVSLASKPSMTGLRDRSATAAAFSEGASGSN
ncbi:Der1-like family-domain-containing protein [Chytridium lagenaria]|nr:Der1-like family-domain-containing protein [Chytridium lagenaria]